jgi:CubicO group peptidase (beta-lactamase class C family)
MATRAALALLFGLVSAPLSAGEPVFPGTTWDMPGETPPEGWDAERLRAAEARFQATKPTAVMVVHDGRVVAAWGDVARTVNVASVRKSVLSALYGIAVAEGRIDITRTLASSPSRTTSPG